MANHALPTTTDTYANVLTYLHGRIDDASKWYDSSLSYSNAPVGTVQWDSTAFNWKKNTGTVGVPVWTTLAAYYNININGTVGATTAAAGTFTTLTVNTSAALPATATMGGSTIANLGSSAQTFTGSMSFTNASPIVSAKIGPSTGQQHTVPAVTSDTIALIAASQTLTNKTYSSGALSGTFSGNHTVSGQATFTEATAPIISARIGPSSTQQHVLPVVASDTIALLAATQTFTNKTLTSPTISGGTISNAPISGSTGSFTSLTSTSGYVQSPGLSTAYGTTSGTSTGAFNAVMGAAASATWLLSGTSGGVFRYGIQGLDAGGALRLYSGTNWLNFDGTNLTNSTSQTFLTSANYNTYAPTLTGTGASGTWSITAATANALNAANAYTGTSFNNITGLSSTTPAALGTAAVGTATTVARADHVHAAPTTVSGSAGSVVNSLTINNGGAGSASGSTYNGSAAITISHNSIGASPLAGSVSLTTTGTVTSGTWSASFGAVSGANLTNITGANVTGTVGSATNATNATNLTGSGTISSTTTATTKAYGTGDTTVATTAFVDALRDVPTTAVAASYTLALTDRGKSVDFTGAAAQTITIPANATVAFPIGSVVTITNTTANNLLIAITTDTLRQAGTANVGTRTLGQYGVATARKVASTLWIIGGSGLT